MGKQTAYAAAGVDFGKEHEVVGVFKKLFDLTKAFTRDLEEEGVIPPAEIGYFSDGVKLNLRKLIESFGEEIVLVGGADGAGTKPLAHQLYRKTANEPKEGALACVGIDAVAMVANDLICGGARPAFIWDYVAWENPQVEIARELATGLLIGAEQSVATVIGGENASLREMIKGAVPGMGYDISCTGIGFVTDKRHIGKLTGEEIKESDVILGLRSSGLHCNGISLSRKSLVNCPELGWSGAYLPDEIVPELGKTALEEILTPTVIYAKAVLFGLLRNPNFDIKGIANITGEGVLNLHRLLKGKEFGAEIDLTQKVIPGHQPVFDLIQKHGKEGGVNWEEMYTDFNMGWGMYVIAPEKQAPFMINELQHYRVEAHSIGRISKDSSNTIAVKDSRGEYSYKPS